MESSKQNYHETFGAYICIEIIINWLDCKGILFALFWKKKKQVFKALKECLKVEKNEWSCSPEFVLMTSLTFSL